MIRGLALRLEGPMQAWGGPVAGDDRPSFDAPTKSGVLGIIGGALGIARTDPEPLVHLHARLALVVRVDRPGARGIDFHTALDVPLANGKRKEHPVVSRRSYLHDASFVALLVEREPGNPPLERIADALRWPRYAPFLGRRACPPSVPVLALRRVLEGESWEALLAQVPADVGRRRTGNGAHDVLVEADLAPGSVERPLRRRDVLVGPLPRLFGERTIHPVVFASERHAQGAGDNTVDAWYRK